ncbi:ABC transporter ATP-binding protein [Janthinobacterium sp. 17J80-10]|uniref:ABC transporter ATP-binding protein n=1 Tax=Janthinobacterium sp. 17J80-10 TaxID=2497863 RepID=UPI001005588E|nr:ABC transporter ATP-binding protein [Janthinobacterium sp. 17J80-10]QAU32851.1 ABC transporter ATP-binding protein [Janthinobacterium sp. 17J80-10]
MTLPLSFQENPRASAVHAGRIVFDGVSKRYEGKAGQPGTLALDDLRLSIAPSEIVAVLGPTGCGKSSALNLIAGFEEPTQGRVLLDGQEVHGTNPDRAIVFQHGALFPWLSVFDNTVLGLKSRGIDKQTYTRRARELLAEVGLAGFENHYPYQLSGGMQQRVQIARALVSQPRILLMDEPFGALDYQTRIQMQELLLQLWQEHRPTVFFITHDVTEAIFVADRVLVMSSRPGRVTLEVPVHTPKPRSQEFLSSPEFIALQSRLLQAVQNEVRTARAASPILT